jgi:hypothetical protein
MKTSVVTKAFCEGDEMPLWIDVPVRIPIADFETEHIKLVNCYTTGKSVSYLLSQVRHGQRGVVFGDYRPGV